MKRDLKQLADQTFDLVVIGAGIYGSTIAWDATSRGLSVALIDKTDFGANTSANSLKIVHGGLRYLQQLDIKRMRESIRERRIYMKIAPHLVHPLSCVMPTYGHMMKGPEIMRAGMLANDMISLDRNRLEDPEKKIPAGKVISKQRCLEFIPGIADEGVNGGAFWTDAQVYNTERFNLSFILSSVQEGCIAANYAEATGLLKRGNRIEGVHVKDRLTGDLFDIRCKVVVNAAGGWLNQILKGMDHSSRVILSTAMNLVVNRKLLTSCAAGISAPFEFHQSDGNVYRGSRVLFMTPWRHATVIGTFHRPYDGNPDSMHVSENEIQDFLDEINRGYPKDLIKREEVSFVYKGFLPMDGINQKTGDVVLTKHYHIHDHHKEDSMDGLISVSGVKYTTARDVAVRIVNLVFGKLDRKGRRSTSHLDRLKGGDIDRFDTFISKAIQHCSNRVSERSVRHMVYNYGSDYTTILDYGRENNDWLRTLPGSHEILQAEVVHAIREEAAQKLSDVVFRRTDLGSAGYPGKTSIQSCADIMAGALNWDLKRKSQEIDEVNDLYQVVIKG